jgi:beta-lactamase class A
LIRAASHPWLAQQAVFQQPAGIETDDSPMRNDYSRREILLTLIAAALPSMTACARSADSRPRPVGAKARRRDEECRAALAMLEARVGGRLAVAIRDESSGEIAGWREHERVAMASTFKLLLAGVILHEVDRGTLALDTLLSFSRDDLVPHAPVVEQHLEGGALSIATLAEATQITSDNVAANLLLQTLDGPRGFTARLRAIGDTETRLDRYEIAMNGVEPGDPRDTTTPSAIAATTARLVGPDLLSTQSRQLLKGWMVATQTGKRRIRAGLPESWIAGDKTGTALVDGLPNRHNDVAVVWLRGRAPLVIAAFYESPVSTVNPRPEDDAVLAEVGRIAARWANEREV